MRPARVALVPHNPLKRPMFALYALVGAGELGYGLAQAMWWVAVVGAAVLIGSVAALRVIASGRNPRRLRAPLARWWARRRR